MMNRAWHLAEHARLGPGIERQALLDGRSIAVLSNRFNLGLMGVRRHGVAGVSGLLKMDGFAGLARGWRTLRFVCLTLRWALEQHLRTST